MMSTKSYQRSRKLSLFIVFSVVLGVCMCVRWISYGRNAHKPVVAAAVSPTSPSAPDQHSGSGLHSYNDMLARLRQEVFCEDVFPSTRTAATSIKISSEATIYIHDKNDAHSEALKKDRSFEPEYLSDILWAMKQPVPGAAKGLAEHALFVEVGARVGLNALKVAAQGYNVIAFEEVLDNQKLFRKSLCASSSALSARITLQPYGVGPQYQKCYAAVRTTNMGDVINICGFQSFQDAQATCPYHYRIKDNMESLPLQWFVKEDIKVLKVSAAGQGLPVLQGAKDILTQHRIWFMLLDFSKERVRTAQHGGYDESIGFLHALHRLGYLLSIESLRGPFLNAKDVLEQLLRNKVHRTIYVAHESMKSTLFQ